VNGGTPAYFYSWSTSPVQNLATATGLCPGTYTLCVTDINGCASCSTVTVNFSSGMENASDNSLISVYPVPFGEEFTLQFDKQIFANGNAELTITNLLGEKIGEMALNSATTMINTSKWDAGVYFISVRTSLGVITKKIVKE
jgi:hypothetical protein